MSMLKYHFGRLNIIAKYPDKYEFILIGLRQNNILLRSNHLWGFFDIEPMDVEEGLFIHGYLVKYKPEKLEEVIDPENHKIAHEEIKDSVVAKSRFFLHIKSGIIIYHPDSVHIRAETFNELYSELFEKSYDNFFVDVSIQTIEERFKIFDVIDKFDYIERVNISLHPSNPRSSKIWEGIDKNFKELGIGKYQEHYEAKSDSEGLKIKNDEDVKAKITMADDGYGKADVTGVIDRNKITVSTKDNPVIETAPGDDVDKENVFEYLKGKLQEIFSRSNKDEN